MLDSQKKAPLTLMDAIYRRRSVRNYTTQPVDRDVIRALIDAAIHAPTAMHEEPWAFAVIEDQALLNRISESAKDLVRAGAEGKDTPRAKEELSIVNRPGFHVFYNASTLILICSKIQSPSAHADCWLAAENLMLAACAKGLGSCVIGFSIAALNSTGFKAELKIPEGVTVIAPIIVGHPVGETPVSSRKPPEILSWK